MSHPAMYDDDILIWAEEQAEIIRRLGRTRRDLPNEFDIENVAEEIESVGRSELASVKSLLRQVLLHLIKLTLEKDAAAAEHWRDEIFAFHAELVDRYAPSMRRRIDMNELWGQAHDRALRRQRALESPAVALPSSIPFSLDDLLGKGIDPDRLADGIREAMANPTRQTN